MYLFLSDNLLYNSTIILAKNLSKGMSGLFSHFPLKRRHLKIVQKATGNTEGKYANYLEILNCVLPLEPSINTTFMETLHRAEMLVNWENSGYSQIEFGKHWVRKDNFIVNLDIAMQKKLVLAQCHDILTYRILLVFSVFFYRINPNLLVSLVCFSDQPNARRG